MDILTLQKHVLTLATIEETDAPMISCYLNLEKGLVSLKHQFQCALTEPPREASPHPHDRIHRHLG